MATYQTSTDAVLALHEIRAASTTPNSPEGVLGNPQCNNRQELLVSQSLPPKAEITRLGQSWSVFSGTAVAAVTAMPTTAAHFSMFNGETAGSGKSYILDEIGYVVTTASGAAGGVTLAYCVNKGSQTALSSVMSVTPGSNAGKTYSGLATFKASVTIVNDGWVPASRMGASDSDGTVAVGSSGSFPIDGGIIVPPQFLISFATIGVNATLATKIYIKWHEAVLPLA